VPRPGAVLTIGDHQERTVAGSLRGTAADLRCCGDHRPLRVDGVHVHGVPQRRCCRGLRRFAERGLPRNDSLVPCREPLNLGQNFLG
jgi:hypothetical protein